MYLQPTRQLAAIYNIIDPGTLQILRVRMEGMAHILLYTFNLTKQVKTYRKNRTVRCRYYTDNELRYTIVLCTVLAHAKRT
jgi:hypothetical protein